MEYHLSPALTTYDPIYEEMYQSVYTPIYDQAFIFFDEENEWCISSATHIPPKLMPPTQS